jgi:hypothetical protein
MFGYLLADALAAGVVFWLCWRYRRFPRLVAVAAPVGAFFTVMALPAVHAALAESAATLPGMIVLAILAGAGTLITFSEALFGKRHHPVWTPVIGVVYGMAVAVLVTDKALIGEQARQVVPASQAQLSQSIAGAAPPHVMATSTLTQHRGVLIAVAVAVAVFALWLRRHHRKHQQPRAKPLTAHRKVIAAGKRASAITGGRKPQGWEWEKASKKKGRKALTGSGVS